MASLTGILSKISRVELALINSKATQVRYRAGKYLVREGSADQHLVFILEGQVNVTRVSLDGQEVILAQLGAGDYFGEISLLTGTNRTANVIALSPCTTLELSQKDFLNHIKSLPGLMLLMLSELARRLEETSSRLSDSTFLDVSEKLMKLLSKISTKFALDGKPVRLVRQCPTHRELAARIGSSREVVTRLLKSLEKSGRIVRRDKQIIILS